MRELQVLGLDTAGKKVLFQEKGSDERFSVPADDRLRAAARGDLSRLGQIEVEMNSQLRPREIQAKVRAGASVAEVASLAGIPESRVERFAHPVLLERGNAADIGRNGHPIRPNGPAEQSLDEIVTAAFRSRGLDAESGEWDAWRNTEGEWIVQLAWQVGRSDNAAHWRLYKEGLGGTLTALDDAAHELIDPDFTRPRRPLAPVSSLDSGARVGVHGPEADPAPVDDETVAPHVDSPQGGTAHTGADTARHDSPAPVSASEGAGTPVDARNATDVSAPAGTDASAPGDATVPTADGAPSQERAAADDAAHGGAKNGGATNDGAINDPAANDEEPQDALIPHPEPHQKTTKGRKNKPAMPSWEDVLLGVRSNNG